MKAKQSIRNKRLVSTLYLMTAILVAALFLGGAASAGIARNTTMTETINNAQTQTTINVATSDGLAPYIGEQPYTPGTQAGDMLGTPFYVCNAYSPYNIYTFTPSTPGSPVLLGNPGIGTYTMGATFDDDGVYWASSSTGSIYKISTSTGVATLVGATGLASVGGLSYDRTTGKLWGYSSGAYALYTINKATGAATLVWTLGSTYLYVDIAINSIGECYGIDIATDSLIKINLATGTQTVVGSFGGGYNLNYAQGAGFDRDTGILYSAAYVIAPATDCFLGTINTATGALTKLASFPASWEADGLAIPYQTQAPHDIVVKSIDAPATGTGTASIIPKVTVYNNGFTTENFNVSMKIFQELGGTTQLYSEGFENWVPQDNRSFPPPGGWGVTDFNGGSTWVRNSSVRNARSGWNSSCVRNDPTQNDDILYTKSTYIAANGTTFSFYYKVWQNGAPETFRVGWWNGTGPLWHWFDTVTSTNGLSWTKYEYNLPDNFTTKNIWFAVNYISNDWMGLRVDDFKLPDGTTEGFEGIFGYFTGPSTNWINVPGSGLSSYNYWRKAVNADVESPNHLVQQGLQEAWYRIYPRLGLTNVSSLQMTTPLNFSSYGQELMMFQFWLYQTSSGSSYQDKVALEISIDNGVTWTQLGEWRQYDALNPLWNKKAVSLAGYEEEKSVLFRFKASAGSALGYDITIDNVTIVAVPVTTLATDTQTVSLAAGATTQVSFTSWALPGWQSPLLPYNNTNVKYNVKVKAILTVDPKPANNVLRASPLIYYPYLHDVGITAIDQPVTGPGAASVPVSYTIKNFGQYAENGAPSWFVSNISIYDYPVPTGFARDFSDSVATPEYYGPNNWTEQHIAGTSTGNFDAQTSGSSPTCTPKVGYRMLRYNSFSITSGGIDRLYTQPLNLSGLGPVRLKFWMMHDTGYLTNAESVTWQWSIDGTTWNDLPLGTFYRSTQLQGLPAANAWYEWKVDLTPIENMSSVRIGMLCKSFFGNNMFFDDVRVYQMGTLINKFQEGFEIYDPSLYTFGPGFTKIRQDNWQTWKIAGTTPATFYATCTEVGSFRAQKEWLITPTINCSALPVTWLSFTRQLYLSGTVDSNLTVFGSDDGGVTWGYQILYLNSLTGSNTYEAAQPWMAGKANVKLAFRFWSSNDTSKLDYAIIDNIVITDRTITQEYMVPYVPPVVLNPGNSVTVTPVNWNPLPQPSGPHNYKASANTFLSTDANALNNNLLKFFTLTYGHDLSVQAITQPSAGWFAAGTYPVAGTIKNLGTYTESKTATATIYDASSTVVYTGTFAVTSLASGAEVTATFASWVISTSGEYKLKIEVPADDNNANNFKELPGIKIDATAPVSTHTLSPAAPNGLNGWYISDVSITLSASDTGGSGVASIKYQVDGGSWQTYSGAISISTDGTHTVKYYAIDNVANTEGEHTIPAFKIDKTKPTITLTATSQNAQNNQWLLEATVSDATSGVAKVEFYIAGALIGTVTTAPYEYLYEGTDGPAKAIVYDNAGNSLTSPDVSSHESSQSQSQSHSTILAREIKQL